MPKRREELEIWLADGPEMDEILQYILSLNEEIDIFRSHLSKSDLHMIDYKLVRRREGDPELAIRRQWDEEISALNLKWAKTLAKCKQEVSRE